MSGPTLSLNEVVCLMAGIPAESARAELGRLIWDQNVLRRFIVSCVREFQTDPRLRRLLRSFTLAHVPNPEHPSMEPPIARWWPPAKVVHCIDRRRRHWPVKVDQIRDHAAQLDRKWREHDALRQAGFERLMAAAQAGKIRLYYLDAGLPRPLSIPATALAGSISTTPDKTGLVTFKAPICVTHPQLSKSQRDKVFLNVLVSRNELEALLRSERPRLTAPQPITTQPLPGAIATLKVLTSEETLRQLSDFNAASPGATESQEVAEFKKLRPDITRDHRGEMRKLKRDSDQKPRRGRPPKR